jgi:apolipoprotein D and lipocalin family protein
MGCRRKDMRRTSLAITAALLLVLAGCASVPSGLSPLRLVDTVDVQRYLGRWYEIARYQHGFESDIVGATAEYSLRDDGKVQVLNSGFKKTLEGPYSEVRAVAWIPDAARPAALKVKFFGLFDSDYLIFGLDQDNYSWALVGEQGRDYVWFLSRTPFVDDALLSQMKEIAAGQGFDLSRLYMVPQKER